jgi:hypothetical protein
LLEELVADARDLRELFLGQPVTPPKLPQSFGKVGERGHFGESTMNDLD